MKTLSFLVLLSASIGCLTNSDRGLFEAPDMDSDSAKVLVADGGVDFSSKVDSGDSTLPPGPVVPSLVLNQIKTVTFKWELVEGATEYKILESKNDGDEYEVVLDALDFESTEASYGISLYQNYASKYAIQSCNKAGCSTSEPLALAEHINNGVGYFKADNPDLEDFFSTNALSKNGEVLVVGAPNEDSFATGVNSDQGSDNSSSNSGAAYVFEKQDGAWIQSAYLKASNTGGNDHFGASLSVSADGKTIAVGAANEASRGIGVNSSEEADDSAEGAGAVYVFTKSGGTWTQIAYIKASNSEAGDRFGERVALSADGSTLAISAVDEAGGSTQIDDDPNDNSAPDSGAVYVFARAGNTWSQQSYLKTNETTRFGTMGYSLAISGTGDRLVTNHESAIFVFERSGLIWNQISKVQPDITDQDDQFGAKIDLSIDGKILAVSAPDEDGNGRGVTGNPNDDSRPDSGAAFIFTEENGAWTQEAYLKASNTKSGDRFGGELTMSDDGKYLAISSIIEGSSSVGVNGTQSDNDTPNSGALYVFERNNATWRQTSYLKATNSASEFYFGFRISISGDGKSLAASSVDSSGSVGVGGDAFDTSAVQSGAVFLY